VAARPALTTRFLDFWLLGGASLAVWAVMVLASPFRSSPVIAQQFRNLTFTSLSLALVVRYPHFLISYKFAYGRGPSFVIRHWWPLIAVPLLLAALFVSAYLFYDVPLARLALIGRASAALAPYGANAQLLAGPRVGDLLLTAGFTLMVFTIGWHYTMQVFGCMMVYARFDRYPLTPAQRRIVKYALVSVWLLSIVDNNLSGAFRGFGGFSCASFDLPDLAGPIAELLVAVGFALLVARVFYANYRSEARLPGVNMLVSLMALYVWWLPQTRQDDFYFLLIPLFHSLQYLAFAFKVEDARLRTTTYPEFRATALVAAVIVIGWLAFELVPGTLDARLGTLSTWNASFFMIAAMLFINIHHYFIDSVAWRLSDEPLRRFLFGQPDAEPSAAIASPAGVTSAAGRYS